MNYSLIPCLQNISDNICSVINDDGADIVNIIGESGSGKSFLLNDIFRKIRENKDEAIILKGDSSKREVDFYPLDDYLSRALRIQKSRKQVVDQLFEEIPIIAKSLKIISENDNPVSLIHQKEILDISELNIHSEFTLHLLSVINSSQLFVLCDDIQYFDKKTIVFLNDLIIKLRNANLPSIKFISTFNTSFRLYENSPIEGNVIDFNLSLPQKRDICKLMQFWGLSRELPPKDIDMIFACTGGHLYLLYSIMEYLRSFDLQDADIANSNSLMNKIITTRLCSFGNKYDEAQQVLCCLSYIGDQVSKSELLCVLEKSNKLNDILNISATQNLLVVKDDYIFFCHEIIRKAFYNLENRELESFYSKFSSCIKSISPSHYAKRAIIETKAANFEQADILFALYACQKMRNGLFSEIPDIKDRFSSTLRILCTEFTAELENAYKLTFEGKNQEALSLLHSTSCAYPYPLWVEKQYLICTLQFKNNIRTERVIALQNIKNLILEVKDDELELWARCAILELVLERELLMFEDARSTRNALQSVLSRRLYFDKDALRLLNSIDLYSDTIDTPPVAHAKLRRLVNRLEAYIKNGNYDQVLDLYIAESNLSGNSLIVGEYKMAYIAAEKALRLMSKFNLIQFSHPEVCLNNRCLALYYMGHKDEMGILCEYKKILSVQSDEDKILLTTNYAGLLMIQGKYLEAFSVIETINEEEVGFNIDRYYAYYYGFNRALILYFNHQIDESLQLFGELKEFVSQISKNMEKYYEKHYVLTINLLQEKHYTSILDLQTDFSHRIPEYISAIWNKFKPVYLFSDLQIWTQF